MTQEEILSPLMTDEFIPVCLWMTGADYLQFVRSVVESPHYSNIASLMLLVMTIVPVSPFSPTE